MVMGRSFKQHVCRILTGTVLFSQLAVAAYACPGISAVMLLDRNQSHPISAAAESDLFINDMGDQTDKVTSNCEQMNQSVQTDRTTQNLCAEHCKYGQQSADRASSPMPPAMLLTTLYATPLQSETSGHIRPLTALEYPPPKTSPPHAILHCCFRI
jgi:hypothetical protein